MDIKYYLWKDNKQLTKLYRYPSSPVRYYNSYWSGMSLLRYSKQYSNTKAAHIIKVDLDSQTFTDLGHPVIKPSKSKRQDRRPTKLIRSYWRTPLEVVGTYNGEDYLLSLAHVKATKWDPETYFRYTVCKDMYDTYLVNMQINYLEFMQ